MKSNVNVSSSDRLVVNSSNKFYSTKKTITIFYGIFKNRQNSLQNDLESNLIESIVVTSLINETRQTQKSNNYCVIITRYITNITSS